MAKLWMEVEDSATDGGFVDMQQVMQYKENIWKFRGINAKNYFILVTGSKSK